MRFDFSHVQDVESYVSVPEGVHVCRVAEVRDGLARDGSTRWSLRLEVAEGQWAGRTAAWDGLTWSERGLPRVKRTLQVLGFDVRGEIEILPRDLLGRRVRALLQAEEREDPTTGRRQIRMRVPYAGYQPADDLPPLAQEGEPAAVAPTPGPGSAAAHEDDDDPFAPIASERLPERAPERVPEDD